ncbi:MAG TPA: TrpB-like pyridoxal phosphate-dependent enzyme [Candidatus Limnocylindrales bacterium]|nr:TrpB-like pyridoxal phosphate-dependent enzyme [Candidatus Limnocylindrales bacterium]
MSHSDRTKFVLDDDRLPRAFYNIAADLPEPPPPPLHPGTGQPIGPADLAPLFPMELIKQVVSTDREIEIPDPVRDAFALYRPSPLYRARRLEKVLDTPAHIYYKYEGVSPSGSHKPNTAIAQAFYNKQEGVTRLATETGAGQWGSALAFAGSLFGLEVKVFMVRASYDQKPYRRILMETYGANVVASPSRDTGYGSGVLAQFPDHTGSLGMAISEAIEDTVTHPGTKYSLGSVFDFVLLHQTVIGQEAIEQMAMAGEEPDTIIACVGGGSNFAGLAFPFIGRQLRGEGSYRVIAVEPTAAPSLTRGKYDYDFGDTGEMAPLVKMHTLGHNFVPPPIHAGGLRYHGMAPLVSKLVDDGLVEARAVAQVTTFEAGVKFARAEGIVPAPESNHAVRVAIDEALAAREEGRQRTILFNLSGHGHFDLLAYESYLTGRLEDYEYVPHDPAAAEVAKELAGAAA